MGKHGPPKGERPIHVSAPKFYLKDRLISQNDPVYKDALTQGWAFLQSQPAIPYGSEVGAAIRQAANFAKNGSRKIRREISQANRAALSFGKQVSDVVMAGLPPGYPHAGIIQGLQTSNKQLAKQWKTNSKSITGVKADARSGRIKYAIPRFGSRGVEKKEGFRRKMITGFRNAQGQMLRADGTVVKSRVSRKAITGYVNAKGEMLRADGTVVKPRKNAR